MRCVGLAVVVALAGCVEPDAPPPAVTDPPRPPAPPAGAWLHDEDGDGVVDAADNCPHVRNPDQADDGERAAGALADGVGDACDPQPALAGNAIAMFVGQFAPTATADLDGDAVRLGVPGWLVLDDPPIPGRAVMQAGVRLATVDGRRGGITMTRLDGGGGCQLIEDRLRLAAPTPASISGVPPLPPNAPLTLALTTASGRWQCAVAADGAPPFVLASPADAPDADVGQVHLYAMADHAWVDYVVVITLAP